MTDTEVVIGTGPDALRAAAVLAHLGRTVHLIQEGMAPSGLRHGDLPQGTGLIHVLPEHRTVSEAVLGALVEGPDPARSVLLQGQMETLPLRISALRRMLPGSFSGVGKNWLRAKGRNAMAEIIGGGMEERSHRDWVVRRMGEPAWHHLYRTYALRRWGLPSEKLASSVARVYHGGTSDGPVQVVGGTYAHGLERAGNVLSEHGATITCGRAVAGLDVEDGRVRRVRLEDGSVVEVSGKLWVSVAPNRVAEWLGAAVPKGVHVHANECRQLPAVRVALRGSTRDLPTETHVLDERASFWRVTSPYGIEGAAIFHFTDRGEGILPSDDRELVRRVVREASAVGLSGFSEEDARVERLPAWQPLWGNISHSRFRSVSLEWEKLGIVGIGRGGAMAALDPGEEIGLVVRLCEAESEGGGQMEVHRLWCYPPVRALELNSSMLRLVTR